MTQSTSFAQMANNQSISLSSALRANTPPTKGQTTSRKFLTLSIFLLLSFFTTNAWGETWSHEFTSLPSISDQEFIVSDLTWNVTTTTGKGSPSITSGNDYSVASMKFGSGKNNYYSNIALSTSDFFNYNVKSVEIIGCGNAANNINITVTQGSNENIVTIGSATINKSYANNWNNISECIKTINTNEGSGGLLTISISPTTCAFSLRKITVTYETAAATTFTVTYNANGATSGEVPIDDTNYTSGATVTVKQNSGTLAKTGYTFAGWNTEADGTGTTYAAGTGTFTISSNTTLYAKWTANTYTVTWIVDGVTKRTDTGVAYNTSKTAPTVSPIPCGDVIAGWTDAVDGNYEHGTSTLHSGATPSITITSDKTFYAVFADYEN